MVFRGFCSVGFEEHPSRKGKERNKNLLSSRRDADLSVRLGVSSHHLLLQIKAEEGGHSPLGKAAGDNVRGVKPGHIPCFEGEMVPRHDLVTEIPRSRIRLVVDGGAELGRVEVAHAGLDGQFGNGGLEADEGVADQGEDDVKACVAR